MRKFIRWGAVTLALAGVLAPLQTLHAQGQGRWEISPRIGLVFWDNASALQDPLLSGGDCDFPEFNHECASTFNSLMAGISALYGITDQIQLGLAFDVSRPVSNGAYFPAATIEIGGLQQLTLVSQRLTVIQYQVEGEWSPTFARLAPFVTGGLGGYTVYKDAAKADQAGVTGFETFTGLMFSVGVGLNWAFGEGAGIRAELRDMIYTDWDRNELNPVLPQFQTDLFPDLLPEPPGDSSTLNNFRLSVGFFFIPGGGS